MRNPLSLLYLAALMHGGAPAEVQGQATLEAPVNRTVEALILAYNDERRAEAFYAAVMAKHGEVRPFSNIIQAERRHQAMLVPLLERFGVPIPAEEVEIPEVPETLRACCEAGTRAEEENIALHDKLLPTITDDAVLDAFKRLQWASRERHLVAFKRCAEGGGQGMGGRGPGGGGGRGRP